MTGPSTIKAPPLCKDCRHAKRSLIDRIVFSFRSYTYAKCAASPYPKRWEVLELIDGRRRGKTETLHCQTARQAFGDCGPEGKLYEPKGPAQ